MQQFDGQPHIPGKGYMKGWPWEMLKKRAT